MQRAVPNAGSYQGQPRHAQAAPYNSAPSMGFIGAIKTCFSKYVDFKGRARRPEYWWWVLFNVLVGLALGIIDRETLKAALDAQYERAKAIIAREDMLRRTATLYKTSFTGLSAETWLLSVVILINRSGTMVVPFMTLYLTSPSMGRSLSDAGTVMGLFGLGSVIGAFFGGKFSDKIGFQKVQLITLLAIRC